MTNRHDLRLEINPYHDSKRKRASDIFLGSALLGPAGLGITVATPVLRRKLDDGPLYYRDDQRIGVPTYKLRTMKHPPLDQQALSVWEASNSKDERVVCEWIRNLRLDELPQIVDAWEDAVTPGPRKQSIVGIRKLQTKHAEQFRDIVMKEHPEEATFWWDELLPNVQDGAVSQASARFSRRSSNGDLSGVLSSLAGQNEIPDDVASLSKRQEQEVFATQWVFDDLWQNHNASVTNDFRVAGLAARQLGHIGLQALKTAII